MARDPSPTLRERLEAIRDRLTNELDEAEGSQLAAVAKELRAVLVQLESVAEPEGSAVDELTKRRAARKAGTPDAPAARRSKRGGA